MFRAAAGIIVVATVIGALMPAPARKADAASEQAAEPWFAESSSSSRSSSSFTGSAGSSSSGEVRLVRDEDGHFYADVAVNGTTLEFMIDTGASGLALTAADAQRAGVQLDPNASSYVGQGAGGALTGQMVRLDRVQLGGRSAEGMSAAVIDGASTNLLGQSFLERFQEVTVRGDVMTLR